MRRPQNRITPWPTLTLVAGVLGLLAAGRTRLATANDIEHKASDLVMVEGRVLGPDGNPVSGSKLYIARRGDLKVTRAARSTTDATGSFSFSISRAELPTSDSTTDPLRSLQVLAEAKGLGPAWTDPGEIDTGQSLCASLEMTNPSKGHWPISKGGRWRA
jgi:hypothetical protein